MHSYVSAYNMIMIEVNTLKREPIEENFDDLEDSSATGGKRPATKEHLETLNKSWCSGTT